MYEIKQYNNTRKVTNISSNAFDSPGLTIKGYKGTYAEKFATNNKITFNSIISTVTGLK